MLRLSWHSCCLVVLASTFFVLPAKQEVPSFPGLSCYSLLIGCWLVALAYLVLSVGTLLHLSVKVKGAVQ